MKFVRCIILILALVAITPVFAGVADPIADEQMQAEKVHIKVALGAVVVENTTNQNIDVEVYSITGARVKIISVPQSESMSLDLIPGVYIVRAGGTTQRVLVR